MILYEGNGDIIDVFKSRLRPYCTLYLLITLAIIQYYSYVLAYWYSAFIFPELSAVLLRTS